jgi:hypothetical protein
VAEFVSSRRLDATTKAAPGNWSGFFLCFGFGRAEVLLRLCFLQIRTMLPMRNIGAAQQRRPTLEDEAAKPAKKK